MAGDIADGGIRRLCAVRDAVRFAGVAMTAPIRGMPELYRIITDYEALQDGFADRIEELETTFECVDEAGGLTRGNAQRLLTKNEGKPRKDRPSSSSKRTFGWESLGKMLKGTGLALVLVVDDERFAPTKEQLVKRKRPRQPAFAGSTKPTWLFSKEKAREMGKKRFAIMSESERKRHQRRAGRASAKARRRKAILPETPPQNPSALNLSQSSGIA